MSLSDNNCIVILLFNNCFEVQFPLSPLVIPLVVTYARKLNKVVITTTSGDNEYIHLVNFLPFHEIFEITPGDNRNCTSKHLLNKKMTMFNVFTVSFSTKSISQ